MDEQDLEQTLGARIRLIRISRGMTQEELGNRANVRRTHIVQIEKGNFSVRVDTLNLLAKAFGISLSELFEDVG